MPDCTKPAGRSVLEILDDISTAERVLDEAKTVEDLKPVIKRLISAIRDDLGNTADVGM